MKMQTLFNRVVKFKVGRMFIHLTLMFVDYHHIYKHIQGILREI